jgi:5-formyltetrahydrofolate cyclo-ligase
MIVEKRAIRQQFRERRRALSGGVVEACGRAVRLRLHDFPPYEAARAVIGYVCNENEVPTGALLEDAVRAGRTVYLPLTAGGVARWRPGDGLVVGRGGVREPAQAVPDDPEIPALALVPVVAWDRYGTRLGRGGGFYDRLFATLTSGITRVGVAYEFQECAALPRDPWDALLHFVITERRLVRCGGSPRSGLPCGGLPVEVSVQKGGLQLP